MGEDEFEQELRPGGHFDPARPTGERTPCKPVRQPAALEGPVADDRDAAFPRERQQAPFRLTVHDVVGELDEIRRAAAHDLFQFAMPAAVGGSDAGIAERPRLLHGFERVEVRLPFDQVVDLQQVEAPEPPPAGRFRDLRRAVGGAGPDLVGGEEARRTAELRERIADHRLRGPVHGRGIDHAPARLEKGGHDGAALGAEQRVAADIEGDPAAEPDRRHRLAGRRNALRERPAGSRAESRRRQRRACARQDRPPGRAHGRCLPSRLPRE